MSEANGGSIDDTGLIHAERVALRGLKLSPIDMRQLSPLQRVLLVADGTVTALLEAYDLEPIDVIQLSHALECTSPHTVLDLPLGAPVVRREVILRGRQRGIVRAHATSWMVQHRCPVAFWTKLEHEGYSIGRALQALQIETYREILWWGREDLCQLPTVAQHLGNAQAITREYVIYMNNQPALVITERYPASGAELRQ